MATLSTVFTERYAAKHFGIDIDSMKKLAEEMAPEEGCVSVINSLDNDAKAATVFTRRGLD